MSGHTPPSPTPQALRLQEEWPGVLWLEWEGGEMQSEASEVTLGGKAHVGPGCVCTTRHQPSWLDRGILFCFVLCVSLFYFHDPHDYIGRRSLELGAGGVFPVAFTVSPVPFAAYGAVKEVMRRRDVGSGSARPDRPGALFTRAMIGRARCGQLPHGVRGRGKGGHRYRYIPAGQGGLKIHVVRPSAGTRETECAGEQGGGGCRNLLVCLWLGGPAANQAQWFAWEREGRRDHPSHHYHLARPAIHAPPLHTRIHTSWSQGPSRDRVAGSRGQAGMGGEGVGRWTGTGRDRDARAEVGGLLGGWMAGSG